MAPAGGQVLSDADAATTMYEMDTDGDGVVDMAEFAAFHDSGNNDEGGNDKGEGPNNNNDDGNGDGHNDGNDEGGGGNSCDNTIADCCRQHGQETDCRSKVGVCTWFGSNGCGAAGVGASKCTGVTYSNAIFCLGQSEPGCREVPGNPNQCEWKGTCAPLPTEYCAALPEDCAAGYPGSADPINERDCRAAIDVCRWVDSSNGGSCVAK